MNEAESYVWFILQGLDTALVAGLKAWYNMAQQLQNQRPYTEEKEQEQMSMPTDLRAD
ncbi:MAG TPA: hypothetical protein VFV38_26420 [Ktedonobacteraceae bacterium]|nr:hypothetical protein [Ktedonobacteraceae bacterium]